MAVLFGLALQPLPAFADNKIPDHWRPYTPKHLELNPGYKMYQVSTGRSIRVDTPGDEWPRQLQKETVALTPDVFGGIRTAKQAEELCELLIHGALVEDAKSYDGLLKVHQDAGFKQQVKDAELAFGTVTKPVEGGFQIEFTAFHLPQTMGPSSVVARYVFFVGKDARAKIESTTYLEGMLLNWQTGPLDSREEQEKEARALARVRQFVEDCYKHCPTRIPRIPEEKQVPTGFSLERRSWDVGVLPVQEDFIRIRPVDTAKGKVYMLTAGTTTKHFDKPEETIMRVKKELTAAQCQALYNEALNLGFFKMKDVYSEEEDGGSASSISITANGVTKKVAVYNTEVPEVDKLTARIRALSR